MPSRFPAFPRFLIAFFASTLVAGAQVVFTVTATSDSTGNGYVSGQSYSFVYTTAPSYPLTAFTNAYNDWSEERTTDSQLFTAVSGTGLLGSFVRPASQLDDPYSLVHLNNGSAQITAGADDGVIGLTALGGTALASVITNVSAPFSLVSGQVDISTYFADYVGSYPSTGGNVRLSSTAGIIQSFTVTNFAIAAPSAVPEPGTSALLAGAAALAGVLVLRRRTQA